MSEGTEGKKGILPHAQRCPSITAEQPRLQAMAQKTLRLRNRHGVNAAARMLVLLTLLVMLGSGVSAEILIDKPEARIGDLVHIRIAPALEHQELVIITPNSTYRFIGGIPENAAFVPEMRGVHTIRIIDGNSIVDTAVFTVTDGAIIEESEQEFSVTPRVRIGEPVVINAPVTGVQSIGVRTARDEFQYLERIRPLAFIPQEPGAIAVWLRYENGTTLTASVDVIGFDPLLQVTPEEERTASAIVQSDDATKQLRTAQVRELAPGTYDVEVKDISGTLKNVRFAKLRHNASVIKAQHVPAGSIKGTVPPGVIDAFAIDPSGLEFESASFTFTAVGIALYKCKEYNYTTQECYGKNVKIMDLIPGQEYTLPLDRQDPLFSQTGYLTNPQFTGPVTTNWTTLSEGPNPVTFAAASDPAGNGVAQMTISGGNRNGFGNYYQSFNLTIPAGTTLVGINFSAMWRVSTYNSQAGTVYLWIQNTGRTTTYCSNTSTYNAVTNWAPINITTPGTCPLGNFTPDTNYTFLMRCNLNTGAGGGSTEVCRWDNASITVWYNDTTAPVMRNATETPDPVNFNQTLNISVNITDNIAVSHALVEINGTNYTMIDGPGDIYYYDGFNTSRTPGTYQYKLFFNDTNNNRVTNSSSLLNFTIRDVLAPNVTIINPADNTYTSNASFIAGYNVSDQTAISSCSLNISGVIANSTTNPPMNTLINLSTNLSADGTYQWSIACNDTSNNRNATATRAIIRDTVAPSMSITTADGTATNNATVILSYIPTDINLANCSLWGNFTGSWALNQTNTTPVSGASNAFATALAEGYYRYNIQCTDRAGQSAYHATNRTIIIDRTVPVFGGSEETPANGSAYGAPTHRFNSTWNDQAVDAVLFETNISGSLVNMTASRNGSVFNITLPPIAAGTYVYRWIANDTAGNRNATTQSTYTIVRATPLLNLLLNGNASNISLELNDTLNATGYSTPALAMELYRDGLLTNTSQGIVTHITNLSQVRQYNTTLVVNETQNYSAATRSYFATVIDRYAPLITLDAPENDTIHLDNITLLFTPFDEVRIANCSLFINGTLNQTKNATNGTQSNFTFSAIDDGAYSWAVNCSDAAGNSRMSGPRSFFIDTQPPAAFSLLSPNGSIIADLHPTLTWQQTIDATFSHYKVEIDNDPGFASVNYGANTTPATNTTYAFTLLDETTWHWRVTAYDRAGNIRTSDAFNFTVDTQGPDVELTMPVNNTYAATSSLNLSYTAADFTTIANCSLMVDGTINQTDPGVEEGTNTFSATLPEGTYSWAVRCADIGGNSRTTTANSITIDLTPPAIFPITGPANGTMSATATPTYTFNQTTEQNFANYTVEVSDDEAFPYANYTIATTNINNTSIVQDPPLPDGTWHWRVIAYDKAGNNRTIHPTIIVDTTPPTAFSLLSPPNNTESTILLPELLWEQSTDLHFDNYTLQVSTSPAFTSTSYEYSTNTSNETNFSVGAPWGDNTIWYWRVVAYDEAGNNRTATPHTYIADSAAPVVSLVSPANGATYNSNISSLISFVFNVTDLGTVVSCTLEINGTEGTIQSDVLFVEKGVNQTIIESLSSGDYNWSVACIDGAGNAGSSAARPLTVNVSLPRFRLYETSPLSTPQVNASARFIAGAVYASTTGAGIAVPKYRTWNGSAWSAESEMPSAGSPVRWVKMAASPSLGRAHETIAVTVSDDGNLDAYVWNGTNWSHHPNVGSVGTTSNADRSFDIEFETLTGRAMLAYSVVSTNTSRDVAYRTWNGTNWSSEDYINDATTAADIRVDYVRLARNPNATSQEIGLIFIDATNADAEAMIWNGSAWGNPVSVTTTASITTEESIGIAYEQNSYRILTVAGTGSTVAYASYNRTAWTTGTTDINPSAAGTTNYLILKPNPAGNEIMLTGNDANNDLSTALWNGSWSGALRHDATVDGNAQRIFDFEWEQQGYRGILVFGTTAGQITYRPFNATGWTGPTDVGTGANAHSWIIARRVPGTVAGDMRVLIAAQEATSFQLDGATWDGAAFTDLNAAFAASQSSVTYQRFDIAVEQHGPRESAYNNVTLDNTTDAANTVSLTDSGYLSNATSKTFGNYSAFGMLVPKGAAVTFSNLMSAMNPQSTYLTWAAYHVNASGEHLICKKGNFARTSNETLVSSNALQAYAGSCANSANRIILPSDSVRIYTYANTTQNTVTKHIDATQTYAEIEGFLLGNLTLSVTQPVADPLIGEGENESFTCAANCTGGYCLNVRVTHQINASGILSFNDSEYSEYNIILNETTTNPLVLGTINTSTNATFGIRGNRYSFNNTLRCTATSDYANATSGLQNVSVLDKVLPSVTLSSPGAGTGLAPGTVTFRFIAADRRLGTCYLWTNTTGIWALNQTITPNNGSATDAAPVNVTAFGTYAWNVNCTDLAGNSAFATANATFVIAGDLEVRNITFSPPAPVEGTNTTVSAFIVNNVNRTETSVVVRFFNASPLAGGTQIGSDIIIPSIVGFGNATARVNYTVGIGAKDIYALVDPAFGSGNILEFDEDNNLLGETLTVSLWQRFFGNVSGNVTLGNAMNASFVSWIIPNETGNIYITDSDTKNSISFATLRPVGRNTTGGVGPLTADDFEEIDTMLGTTALIDNINTSFTQGGVPRMTESFDVYGTSLADVAVFNVTQNFTTGLLWDIDDSTNSYFDPADHEDLVFIARISSGASEYGAVEYYAGIPSTLKSYRGTTDTVNFYYELH